MEVFIFSQDEQPLTVITAETGLVEAPYRIEINSVPTEPFSFVVNAQHSTSKHVKEENKVVFRDHEGDYRLFVIKRLKDSTDMSGSKTRAVCLPVYHAELNDHVIEERRFIDQTVDVAMDAAVQGTRWQAITEIELGRATTNFYRIFSTEALEDIITTWGGEIKDVVAFNERTNRITGCYLKLIQRHGKGLGQRFEIGHNVVEIEREVLSYPKTALYGFGSSLEVEDDEGNHTGGYTRYIDFGDVEWKKSNGDPVNKPLGQKWVGDPDALDKYGISENGVKRHRDGIFSNQDYEDPSDLLFATWEALQKAKKPEVNYRLSVELFDEKVSLGDTCQAIDRKFARPIEIQARVIAMEYDLMDIEGTMVVEMGQFLDLGDDRIDNIERDIEYIRNNPPRQRIDENSYPNRKPSTPVNLEAYGGMEVIQLYWQYADEMFIKHYEVYGSRTEDFVPDTQHLLWRGDVSAFAHTVGTDEVWYYRVRAVNYHGRPSDWSVQVRAATNRVLTEDIMWGPELAERMRELHRVSDIIGENGVDFDQISQEAKDLINQQARIYTDEEIQATRDGILEEMGIKTDYLDNRIVDLNERANDLISRADSVDDILYDYNVRIDETERGLEFKADSLEVDQINRTVEGHTTEIELLAEGLRSKVEESFVRDAIDGIEVGGRNLLLNTSGNDKVFDFTGWNHPIGNISEYGVRELSKGGEFTFSADITTHTIGTTDITLILQIYRDDNTFVQYYGDVRLSPQETGKIIGVVDVSKDDNYDRAYLRVRHYSGSDPQSKGTYSKAQVEKGNKVTDWSQAPEDILNVQEHHWTEINQNSKKIDLQAESIIEIEGNISSAQASIEVMSEQITNRVTKTIFDDESDYLRKSIAETRNFAEGIEQTVSSIEVGSNNLVPNSKGDNLDGWSAWGSTDLAIVNGIIRVRKGADTTYGVRTQKFEVESGKHYTLSLDIAANYRVTTLNYMYLMYEDGTGNYRLPDIVMTNAHPDLKRYSVTFTPPKSGIVDLNIATRVTETDYQSEGFLLAKVQIENGNMETPWRPAIEDTDQRMTQAESEIVQLADDMRFKVDVDGIVSEINLNREGIRLKGNLIHLDGLSLIDDAVIQNAHIANGTIERGKLERAIIGTAQVEDGAITNAKIASLNADKINAASLSAISANMGTVTAGILRSSNNNIEFNLNNGRFDVYSNASIRFNNTGGGVKREQGGRQAFVSYAVTQGTNYPLVSIGALNSTGTVNVNNSDFRGIRLHSGDALENDLIANRWVFSRRVDKTLGSIIIANEVGLRGIIPQYASTYSYILGSEINFWNRLYLRQLQTPDVFVIRNNVDTPKGFMFETQYPGNGSAMAFRGRNQGSYNYNLGASGGNSFNRLYVANAPNVTSDERRKEEINDLKLGLDFINRIEPKSFRFKLTEADRNQGLTKNVLQYGILAQQVDRVLSDLDVTEQSLIEYDNDFYTAQYEQLIPITIKAVQELDFKLEEEINWQRIEYQYLNNEVIKINDEITMLKEENKALKQRVAQLEESA